MVRVDETFKEAIIARWKSRRQLALYTGLCSASLHYWIYRDQFLSIDALFSIVTASNIHPELIIDAIREVRIHISTIICDELFLKSYWAYYYNSILFPSSSGFASM